MLYSNGIKTFFITAKYFKECIEINLILVQITYTAGNNWGTGAQSAEVQTMDCIQSQAKRIKVFTKDNYNTTKETLKQRNNCLAEL